MGWGGLFRSPLPLPAPPHPWVRPFSAVHTLIHTFPLGTADLNSCIKACITLIVCSEPCCGCGLLTQVAPEYPQESHIPPSFQAASLPWSHFLTLFHTCFSIPYHPPPGQEMCLTPSHPLLLPPPSTHFPSNRSHTKGRVFTLVWIVPEVMRHPSATPIKVIYHFGGSSSAPDPPTPHLPPSCPPFGPTENDPCLDWSSQPPALAPTW